MYNYQLGDDSMISKKARQARILETIGKMVIRSQEELSSFLAKEGVEVTQATLSRDIRELGLIKIRGNYQASGEIQAGPSTDNLRRAFEQFVIRTGVSGNIVMVKTSPGNAHSVGVVLDAAKWPEVLGTVAGDDTVFVLLRNSSSGKKVLGRIREYSI
jgi:transcriptional regulator of arginine metabolism